MILIEEKRPIKISGISSLHIKIDYKPEIINIIKSSGLAVWHKKEGVWECPLTSLSFLLDTLTYYDDIDLRLIPDTESVLNGLKTTLKVDYKVKPFDHQIEAVKFGLEHPHFLLLDSPGLGKTASVIHLAEELKEQRGIEHCLIICGIATLRANWEKEIKFHSNLSYITIGKKVNSKGNVNWATIKERTEQFMNKIDEFFIIVNIESLRDDDVVDAILNSPNKIDMIAFDEVHKASGTDSLQSHNLLKLKNYAYKVGMTGTLLTNSPISAYIPLKFIDIDNSTLTNYKSLYCEFGGFGGHEIVGYKNLDLLKDEIDSCSLRRTKDSMDLPPKNIIDEVIEMNDAHRKFYEDVRKGVKEECDKIELNTRNLLALTTRLRQATSAPSVLTTNPIISSKLERCVELVEDIVSQGDKVVIMSSFKEPVYQLKEMLKKYKPLIGTGDMKDDEVSRNIDAFQTDDIHKVMIVTSAKCGTGITLNRAIYMIMIDEPWTYALYEQCVDRIHRITNTKPVFIYNLICEHTIDERIADIINRKKALADYMIDDKEDIETMNTLKKYILDM